MSRPETGQGHFCPSLFLYRSRTGCPGENYTQSNSTVSNLFHGVKTKSVRHLKAHGTTKACLTVTNTNTKEKREKVTCYDKRQQQCLAEKQYSSSCCYTTMTIEQHPSRAYARYTHVRITATILHVTVSILLHSFFVVLVSPGQTAGQACPGVPTRPSLSLSRFQPGQGQRFQNPAGTGTNGIVPVPGSFTSQFFL